MAKGGPITTSPSPSPTDATDEAKVFQPQDCTHNETFFFIASEKPRWVSVISTPCPFPAVHFHTVMENMLRNPNVTSSHLFRAEILYDSDLEGCVDPSSYSNAGTDPGLPFSAFTKHMVKDYQPIRLADHLQGFTWRRTVVRKLIPRNPNLDRPLPQTCHYFHSKSSGAQEETSEEPVGQHGTESNLVVYVPHVTDASMVPFYHPQVSAVAILHTVDEPLSRGRLSLHYRLFPSQDPGGTSKPRVTLSDRLGRTALHMVQTIHKHMAGRARGYTKRVHHDQIIPQTRVQDMYTRLKLKYAKHLVTNWAEQTDPSKHVFEDLGIAAFLIELWRDMYGEDLENWKGFVDIGCGNGVLVYILRSEGYEGWGFDARHRKSWSVLGEQLAPYLKEMVLVPETMTEGGGDATGDSADVSKNGDSTETAVASEQQSSEGSNPVNQSKIHDGMLPEGTFIISNHADELTLWTPLLASLTMSPYIAIPCCSHNFDGARFRAPTRHERAKDPKRAESPAHGDPAAPDGGPGPKTGTLAKRNPKQLSAYASLCEYLSWVSARVGYEPEREMLRIPSTRNAAIVGRVRGGHSIPLDERRKRVIQLVERETGVSMAEVHEKWISRMGGIIKKPCAH